MKTTNNDAALADFIGAVQDAKALLDRVRLHVDDHFGWTPNEINYAHVGTARETVQQLDQLRRFLGIEEM